MEVSRDYREIWRSTMNGKVFAWNVGCIGGYVSSPCIPIFQRCTMSTIERWGGNGVGIRVVIHRENG